MASPVQARRSSGGAPSRLAALTALSRPADLRPSYSDSEATPSLLAEAPVFEELVFAKRPVPQRGSSPRAAAAPLSPSSVAPSPRAGESSRLTSPNLSATATRSVRTPSLCRSETSVGTSASDAAALASGQPSRCPSGGPTSPVAPNVSLLSAALLSEQAQCPTLRPGCGILVKDGAARTASQDRAAHASFAADSKTAHARFVEPVKPPRQSRRVSLPQPPAKHRESTSPDYMSEGCPAPPQKSILAPAPVLASTSAAVHAAPASPAPRKRALMFQEDSQDVQDRAASRSALGLSRRTSRQASPSAVPAPPPSSSHGDDAWSSPEIRTGWQSHRHAPAVTPTTLEARQHPCDVSPRIAASASPSTLRDSPAAVALHLAASAYSPPASASGTPRSSLRFCGAAATEAARARTLKFASSPGEAAERRAAAAAAAFEPRSKLFAPLARRATGAAKEATLPFSSDDEAPYVDAVADEAQRNVENNTQRRVVLVAARSPRRSGERKRVGRTCGSPAPARLSYQERISAMRGARGGGSPAPLGTEAEYEEDEEYDDEEEDDDEEDDEEVDISGSDSEEEEDEEEDVDDEVQAQQEDGSASSCSSTGDIVTGTLMDEEGDAPTASSRPASRLQLTHFLPDTFDSSAPSSPTWGPARDGEASGGSSAVPSRSVSALTLPLARQPRNIPGRIASTSRDASPSGSMSSGADVSRLAPRSPPSPFMTLGRLPTHRSPLGRAQPSTQRSLSSGAATHGTPSAAACSLLAAAGHGATMPRSPTSGDDAWHRLRHYLDVGHSDGGESSTAAATPGTAPRYFANPAQSRARSVPPGMAQSEARIGSAPASPTPTGYFALLHQTLGHGSDPATDSESEQHRRTSTPGARVLFSEDAKRPASAGGAQAPIRIARPAPNAQSKSDAELSGCAALRRTGLGGAARRRAAASELASAACEQAEEAEGAGKEKTKDKEARRRRRRTADAELAWGWGKARLGGAAPKD